MATMTSTPSITSSKLALSVALVPAFERMLSTSTERGDGEVGRGMCQLWLWVSHVQLRRSPSQILSPGTSDVS